MRCLISDDLMALCKDYKELWKALYAIGAARIHASQWLTTRKKSIAEAIGRLLGAVHGRHWPDFVTEVPDSYAHCGLLAA